MRSCWQIGLIVAAGLALTGCATKSYVKEQVSASDQQMAAKLGEIETEVETAQAEISKLQENDARLEGKIAKLSETAEEALRRANAAAKLAQGKFLYEVTLTDEQVRFGFDRSELTNEARAALDGFAKKVKSENKNVYIEVQGHTDNIGSERYNLELGKSRADQVNRYLVDTHGFPQHRVATMSYGESKPIADNSTAEGRARNRRVTLVVLE